MQEIEQRLLDECDYRKEASYQRAFRKRYQGHPAIVVPEVHLDYSSEKVLTTSFYRGLTFSGWKRLHLKENGIESLTSFTVFIWGRFIWTGFSIATSSWKLLVLR